MPATTRTFVALPMTEEARAALGRLAARLRAEIPGARWVAPENLHVTLAFLGDVPDARLGDVAGAVAGVAADHEPFALDVAGVGVFPDARRPRVLWAGLAGPGAGHLRALHRDLAHALRAAGLPPDDKFSPHVTLARFKPPFRPLAPDLAGPLDHWAGWSGGVLEVAEVVAYASALAPSGPAYTALARAPLGRDKGVNPP